MKKKFLALFMAAFLAMPSSFIVFAAKEEETAVEETKKEERPTFTIPENIIETGVRNAVSDDIILKEAKPGLWKKGKTVYLSLEYIQFEDSVTAEVVSGNMKIGRVEADGNVLKFTIEKESSKEPAEIRLSNIGLFLDGNLPEGIYGLYLITEESEKYPDNLFGSNYGDKDEVGKFDVKKVLLSEDFVRLVVPSRAEVPRLKKQISVDTEDKSIYLNGVLSEETVEIKEGEVMFPVRALITALSDSSNVLWNGESQSVTITMGERIITFQIGNRMMQINGNEYPLKAAPELINGVSFLPLTDLAAALGISEDKISWSEDGKTVTLNEDILTK